MIIILSLILLLGWICGWLVNYICDVMPFRRHLTAPICVECETDKRWLDYLTFRRCKQCRKPRSLRTWIVQIIGVVGSAYLWFYPPKALGFWAALCLAVFFAIVVVMDLEYRVVLNSISIVGVIIGLAVGIWLHGIGLALAGGATGFGLMLLFYFGGDWFAKRLAKKRGERLEEVALGFGDVNLMGILGLILGFPGVTLGLMLGILLGGLVSIIIILIQIFRRQYKPFTAIPYAPFLILGTVLLLFQS